ncbi:MAG TPA: methyltransferase domain-containing protein [Myxococcota bacterium]|nr:methyltransferase domain-containing protein [Myxococcota bacterium]
MLQTTWSEEQVRELLRREQFAYQKIELPYGLSTGGDDRSATARAIFPDDMTGKTVLDVGSKYGFFCFEALRRGAKRAVGVDVDSDSLRKSRLLADCLGANASFEFLDIESDPIEESFDYVLCLNVLHHLRNPIAALDRLIALTRERLVLEVAALGRHDRAKLGISPLARYFLNRAPILYVSRSATHGKRSSQNFFITAPAIDNLLRYQRGSFARVDSMPTGHKDRFISIAHKRRIGRLVVVTGPTSSGKSTMIEQLQNHQAPELAKRLGIEDGSTWTALMSNRLHEPSEPRMEKVLYHYDFLRPYLRGARIHSRDEGLELLDLAEQVTFLTIWCPPEVLGDRLEKRSIVPKTGPRGFRGRKRHLVIRDEYRDPAKVRAHYRRWFDFTRTKRGDHIVVAPVDGLAFWTVDEWEEKTRHLEAPGPVDAPTS